MTANSSVYSYFEAQPAGASNQNWSFARCAGDYVFAGVYTGRIYVSTNRGVSWTEEKPAGDATQTWNAGDINSLGQMIACVGNGRIWSYLSGSWAEQRPAGDANKDWRLVAISPDGTRMMAGIYNGRLYSYYDGAWTEEQPAGAVNQYWRACDITNAGAMIASGSRIYVKAAGGAWSETQPDGNSNRTWTGVALSDDATKRIACADSRYAWRYESGSWTQVNPTPQQPGVAAAALSYGQCACCADVNKIWYGRGAWSGYCNAAMNEIQSRHGWPSLAGSCSGKASAGISQDGSLIAVGHYGGRLYVYDMEDIPTQVPGGYYKEFTFTRAAGPANNYKVRFKIYNKHTSAYLQCEGRANDDFSDIHFQNAAGGTLRHCAVKDERYCNALHTGYYYDVWVELDEVGDTPTTFRMYYGDSDHTDSSTAPADFFDAYDDFERGAHLDAVGGAWTVTAGTVRISTAYSWRGTRSVEFVGASGAKGAANIAAVASAETYIGFFAIKDGSAGLVAQHGDGTTYAQWAYGTDETLKNYTGGAYETSLQSAPYGNWCSLEMYGFDWGADTYDLYYNGTKVGNAISVQGSSGFTNILQLANLGTLSNYFVYVDSLVVCTNCNPFASPDAESIGSEVIAGGDSYSGPAGVKTWNGIPSANIKTWNDIPWNTIKAMN